MNSDKKAESDRPRNPEASSESQNQSNTYRNLLRDLNPILSDFYESTSKNDTILLTDYFRAKPASQSEDADTNAPILLRDIDIVGALLNQMAYSLHDSIMPNPTIRLQKNAETNLEHTVFIDEDTDMEGVRKSLFTQTSNQIPATECAEEYDDPTIGSPRMK